MLQASPTQPLACGATALASASAGMAAAEAAVATPRASKRACGNCILSDLKWLWSEVESVWESVYAERVGVIFGRKRLLICFESHGARMVTAWGLNVSASISSMLFL